MRVAITLLGSKVVMHSDFKLSTSVISTRPTHDAVTLRDTLTIDQNTNTNLKINVGIPTLPCPPLQVLAHAQPIGGMFSSSCTVVAPYAPAPARHHADHRPST
jgi:hypothetical protein